MLNEMWFESSEFEYGMQISSNQISKAVAYWKRDLNKFLLEASGKA